MNKFKVVFHMYEQVKVSVVLNNIRNLISDIGVENLEIEMVTNGDAVKVFVKNTSEFGPMLKELAEKQVVFCACANAMRKFGIRKNELLDFVTVDSSGGGEIVRRKAAGWSYICP
ncbi:MAG: DsrE family protein [Desulfosporosinus sp.]|nr:DsrE family protein [Desulfosporosinus sp.]